MRIKLKPCKHCEEEEEIEIKLIAYADELVYQGHCNSCLMLSPAYVDKIDAERWWNERPNDKLDRVKAEVELAIIGDELGQGCRFDGLAAALKIIDTIQHQE